MIATELHIEIEAQKSRKYDLHSAMSKPFAYGRCPRDEEFLSFAETVKELQKVEYAIEVLENVRCSIISNLGAQ